MCICTLSPPDREEQLRAKGLDPSQYRDSSNSLEERGLNLDLEVSHSEVATTTTNVVSQGQTTMGENSRVLRPEQSQTTTELRDRFIQEDSEAKGNGVGNRGGIIRGSSRLTVTGGIVNKDYPSSTPVPPSLGVPIVTHSKRHQDGTFTSVSIIIRLHVLIYCSELSL